MACHRKERINYMLVQHTFDLRGVQSHTSNEYKVILYSEIFTKQLQNINYNEQKL
jgi:hypothetical protein